MKEELVKASNLKAWPRTVSCNPFSAEYCFSKSF